MVQPSPSQSGGVFQDPEGVVALQSAARLWKSTRKLLLQPFLRVRRGRFWAKTLRGFYRNRLDFFGELKEVLAFLHVFGESFQLGERIWRFGKSAVFNLRGHRIRLRFGIWRLPFQQNLQVPSESTSDRYHVVSNIYSHFENLGGFEVNPS